MRPQGHGSFTHIERSPAQKRIMGCDVRPKWVNSHPFFSIGDPLFCNWIHQSCINNILPQMHPLPIFTLAVRHPGVISAVRPASTQIPPYVSSILFLVQGTPAPGSPEKKRIRKLKSFAGFLALAFPGRRVVPSSGNLDYKGVKIPLSI